MVNAQADERLHMKQIAGRLYRHDGHQWHRAESAVCLHCGLEFLAMVKEIKKGGGKFCSRQCQRACQALINAEANRTVGLTPYERKKIWASKVSPLVIHAHKQVSNAIANGSLKRSACEKCGNQKVDAHHDDYTQPLAVRWLCRAHHLEVHRGGENWRLRAL